MKIKPFFFEVSIRRKMFNSIVKLTPFLCPFKDTRKNNEKNDLGAAGNVLITAVTMFKLSVFFFSQRRLM